MTFRESLLPVVDAIRGLRGPMGLDIQTVQLSIDTVVWSGGFRHSGAATTTSILLPKKYKIRQLAEKEIASSGGKYRNGDVKVGPITPYKSGAGITPAQLDPTVLVNGTEIIYRLSGTVVGEYQLITADTFKAFSYFLVLRSRTSVP